MQLGQCIGLTEVTTSHSSRIMPLQRNKTNHYTDKNFFEDRNYQAILDCMNGGYNAAMALIESMKEYVNVRRNEAQRLKTCSKNCIQRFERLSSLSSYGTTIQVQLQTFESFEQQADIINGSCRLIEEIIDEYTTEINRMYPKKRFGTNRKHCQADAMEKLFEEARKPLQKVIEKLGKKRAKAQKLRASIDAGTVGSENGRHNTTNDNKQHELEAIERQIIALEALRKERKETYTTEATGIFQRCQQFEKKRLEDMTKALNGFIKASRPSHYTDKIVQNFENILANIKTQQDSAADVNQWAQKYDIDTSTLTAVNENDENQDSATTGTDEDL